MDWFDDHYLKIIFGHFWAIRSHSAPCWRFITMVNNELFYENSSKGGKFITVMKIMRLYETSLLWWKFITEVFDENSLLWRKFTESTKLIITMKIHHCDEICSFIEVMIVHWMKISQGDDNFCDKDSLQWYWYLMKIFCFFW